jgi:hypothetical protein
LLLFFQKRRPRLELRQPRALLLDTENCYATEARETSSGNIFTDTGFAPRAAAELTVKSILIMAIGDTIGERDLTQ